jgi:hypothetical protein
VFSFIVLVFLSGCVLESGTGPGAEKKETSPVIIGYDEHAAAADNPFFGNRWVELNTGFIYTFKITGILDVEHHCGLEFDNQFSYLIWKNILVIYGTEMDNTDTLWAGPFTVSDTDISAVLNNGITESKFDCSSYEPDVDYSESQIRLDNIFIGNWQTEGGDFVFKADGFCTLTGSKGEFAEYSYLVRKDRLVTLSHESVPVLREYQFEIKEDYTIKAIPADKGGEITFVRKHQD